MRDDGKSRNASRTMRRSVRTPSPEMQASGLQHPPHLTATLVLRRLGGGYSLTSHVRQGSQPIRSATRPCDARVAGGAGAVRPTRYTCFFEVGCEAATKRLLELAPVRALVHTVGVPLLSRSWPDRQETGLAGESTDAALAAYHVLPLPHSPSPCVSQELLREMKQPW